MNNTEKGMLGGAAVGTGAGALIGRGNPAAMAVGAVVGGIVGGAAGSNQDRREEHKAAVVSAVNAQAARQMRLEEIVQMAQSGQSDAVIIGQINNTSSVFQLTTDDVTYLHQQRVSDAVINYMQSRRYLVVQPRPVYGYPPPPPPYYAEPNVYVGVRGRF